VNSTVADATGRHSPPDPWVETHGYIQTAANAAKKLSSFSKKEPLASLSHFPVKLGEENTTWGFHEN